MAKTNRAHVMSSIVGGLVAVGSAYYLHILLHGTAADRGLVWTFVGMFGVGLFLMFPALMKDLITTVIVVVPQLKWGKRTEDLPIAQAPAGTTPGTPVEEDGVHASIRREE